MKILFTFGGIPHYLNSLLNKLHKKGIEVVVVSPDKGNATIGKGVKMVEGGRYKHLFTPERKMYYGKTAFPELPDIVNNEKPDILVLGWPYFLQIFFQPALRRSIHRNRVRLAIREIPFQTPPYGEIKSYFRENPMRDEKGNLLSTGNLFYIKQRIIAHIRRYCYSRVAGTLNYSTIAYDILPSYGVGIEKIHVTYNTTDTEELWKERVNVLGSSPLLPPSDKRILHIGRLVKWKRVDLLIDAFSKVVQSFPDAELVIIGNGPELENLKSQAENIGVNDRIRFTGAVYSAKELGAYMNESSVYVLAGMGGLSINDAMTYGLPVICSVCDGTERELIVDGKNGYFFKEGDAYSLSEKIISLFNSPQLIRDMGKESENIIREKINLETVTDNYIEAFQKMMKVDKV